MRTNVIRWPFHIEYRCICITSHQYSFFLFINSHISLETNWQVSEWGFAVVAKWNAFSTYDKFVFTMFHLQLQFSIGLVNKFRVVNRDRFLNGKCSCFSYFYIIVFHRLFGKHILFRLLWSNKERHISNNLKTCWLIKKQFWTVLKIVSVKWTRE